jgi:hypothetical protein
VVIVMRFGMRSRHRLLHLGAIEISAYAPSWLRLNRL